MTTCHENDTVCMTCPVPSPQPPKALKPFCQTNFIVSRPFSLLPTRSYLLQVRIPKLLRTRPLACSRGPASLLSADGLFFLSRSCPELLFLGPVLACSLVPLLPVTRMLNCRQSMHHHCENGNYRRYPACFRRPSGAGYPTTKVPAQVPTVARRVRGYHSPPRDGPDSRGPIYEEAHTLRSVITLTSFIIHTHP